MVQDLENVQNDDLGQKLNEILSDPESMNRLAGMASALASSGMLSGLLGNSGGSESDGHDGTEGESAVSLPASAAENIRAVSGRHSALLRALKPYLGQEKQARIDQMMRLLQLAELADTVLRGK